MKKDKFIVTGMSCSNCSDLINKTLSKKDGVVSCDISVLTKEMYLEYDEGKINSNEVCNIVKSLGYRATLDGDKPHKNTKLIRLIISLVLLAILFVIANSRMFHMGIKILDENYLVFSISQLVLSIAILILNFKFYISGFKGIIKLAPNMDTLIMLSSFSAFVYSIVIMIFNIFELELSNNLNYLYFESGAMVLVLVSLGKYIESIAIDSTTKSIKDLVKFLPKTGNLLKNYPDMTEEKININDIKKDDILLVKEGDTIPCDGIVIDGTADVDESLLTGESLYASKNIESKVYKATTLKHGFLIIKALSVGSNSMYDEIIELVNNSASSKAKIGRIADKICKFFVPFIILCAIIAFVIWILSTHDLNLSFSIAISVLVVSCPCALGLATPVAVTVATGKAFQSYCLVKDATVYENLATIKYALFDKTGTITSGDVAIKEIKANIEEDEFKKIVYSLEKYSNHPFALAISKLDISNAYDVTDYSFLPTKGIIGKINNKEVVIGNYQYLKSLNIDIDDEETINTIYASLDGKYIGFITFVDYIKRESIEAIKLFKAQGIKTVLISGDNNEKTKEVATELGFDEYYGEVYPKDKDQILSSYLEKGNTLFIGDGINDSIAITNATVSMSMGTGADIAQNNSGVILKRNNLLDAYNLFGLSKKTMNIIKGNLFWAFFYNIILIPIAMGALSSLGVFMKPMYGAIAMCCSSLFVCLNALRIKTYKYIGNNEKDK